MSIKFSTNVIEAEKTIIVANTFDNSNLFTAQVSNIEFQPDELILNAVSFIDSSATVTDLAPLVILSSTLPLTTNQLCALPNLGGVGGIQKLDTFFKVNAPVNGLYTFYANSITGGDPSSDMAALSLNVALTLTFIKYRPVK